MLGYGVRTSLLMSWMPGPMVLLDYLPLVAFLTLALLCAFKFILTLGIASFVCVRAEILKPIPCKVKNIPCIFQKWSAPLLLAGDILLVTCEFSVLGLVLQIFLPNDMDLCSVASATLFSYFNCF